MGTYTQQNRSLQEVMKDMTWGEKVSYIWDLYKLPILVAVVAVAVVIAFGISLANPDPETLYMGVAVNVRVNQQGTAYLTEEMFSFAGGTDPENQVVDLVERTLPKESNSSQYYQAEVMAITAMVSAKLMDYMLMDEQALQTYLQSGVFSPLEQVLTPQQLEALEGLLVQNEEGIAMAVDITDTAFVRSCVTGKGKVYIAFPGNTAQAELTDDFFDRLLAWTEG